MSQPADEPGAGGISSEEAQQIRQALTEVQQGMASLREARTEPQRQRARSDVREAEADLDVLARQAGISREALERSIGEAKRAEQKEELRPLVEELLAEARDRETTPPDPATDPPAETEGAGGDKPASRGRRATPPKPDDAPGDGESTHFSERNIRGLLR